LSPLHAAAVSVAAHCAAAIRGFLLATGAMRGSTRGKQARRRGHDGPKYQDHHQPQRAALQPAHAQMLTPVLFIVSVHHQNSTRCDLNHQIKPFRKPTAGEDGPHQINYLRLLSLRFSTASSPAFISLYFVSDKVSMSRSLSRANISSLIVFSRASEVSADNELGTVCPGELDARRNGDLPASAALE
jgi:hypothetical protein